MSGCGAIDAVGLEDSECCAHDGIDVWPVISSELAILQVRKKSSIACEVDRKMTRFISCMSTVMDTFVVVDSDLLVVQ